MPLNNFKRIFGRTSGARGFVFGSRGGFTLVELLVVVGIIGVLSATLIGVFGGSSDSALATKCMTNLKELATASRNYAMANERGYFPTAGVWTDLVEDSSAGDDGYYYTYSSGWIAVDDPDWYRTYGGRDAATKAKAGKISPSGKNISTYNSAKADNANLKTYCAITNGAIWAYGGRSVSSYVCPLHKKILKRDGKNVTPAWSYVMNAYFSCDKSGAPESIYGGHRTLTGLEAPDRILLFSELQFDPRLDSKKKSDTTFAVDYNTGSGSLATDCTLNYKDAGGNEHVGFNHPHGRGSKKALLAFADGHVAEFVYPTGGGDVAEITKWLCTGRSISYVGGIYKSDEKTAQ